jgi:2-methylcitrate dehydratase PrpD
LPRPGSLVVGTLFKYHAACYLTHSSIEAIKLLRRQLAFSGSDLASIDLHVAPGHLSVCNIASPRSGLETKFSLRHTAALAACGKDTAAIQTYSDDNARDATLTAVRERVTVHGDRSAGRDAHVVVKTSGGQTAEANFDVAIPDRDLERQGERLAAKFHSLADPVIGAERAGMLQHKIAGLDEDDDIHVLMAA